jgi:CubicO group peptidase (beta-lactamase class C family)
VLTHTSGLPDALGDDYDPLTGASMIDAAMRVPLVPGTHYRYSNLGFSLLAAVVEVAASTSYEEFLAEHLFEPDGMASTGYVLPERDPARVAVEYDEHGELRGGRTSTPGTACVFDLTVGLARQVRQVGSSRVVSRRVRRSSSGAG